MAHRAGHVHVRVRLEGSRWGSGCSRLDHVTQDCSTWEESVSVREFTDGDRLSSDHAGQVAAQVPRGSEVSRILRSAIAWFLTSRQGCAP